MYGEQARENITSTIPADKVNTICDALRALLEARGLEKYVETILTTHVCKIPPDYESGLRVLLQLQGMSTHPTSSSSSSIARWFFSLADL